MGERMEPAQAQWRRLEVNGGAVTGAAGDYRLTLPAVAAGYADAQLDDYGAQGHYAFSNRPGVSLSLTARFSHGAERLRGTAGFGFWNSPAGDPTVKRPALPQAAWFFFASAPGDLPFALTGPGRGWFAGTMNAATPGALALAPLAPLVMLLCRSARLRRRIWPPLRRRLGISHAPLDLDLTAPHHYRLSWQAHGCFFEVDGAPVLTTPFSPRGPLGLVCWLDNQYMVVAPEGRFAWGTLAVPEEQWLEVSGLRLT